MFSLLRDDMATLAFEAQERRRSMFSLLSDDMATLANNPQLDDFVNSFGGLDTVILLEIEDSVYCPGFVHDEILLALEAINPPNKLT